MKAKRIVAAFACALLCAALCAPAAFAAELTAGSQGKAKLQDQAATKTVYVLTKRTEKFDSDGSSPITYNYSYNRSGLLAKIAWKQDKQKTTHKYSYDKSNRLTKIALPSGNKAVNKYSKGKLVQTTITFKNRMLTKEVYKATYKSGKIAKKTRTQYFKDADGKKWTDKLVFKYSHNKKGLITKYGSKYGMTTYKYDAHNNFVQASESDAGIEYRNKYNSKGNLVQKAALYAGHVVSTTKFTYKKVRVKKAVAKIVEQQQWSLLNGDLNNAISLQD